MHVGSKTFGERQLEIFEVGEMQFTFPTSRSKYWLDKDFAFVRVFGTIRATRKTGDKGVTVFHNLDADAISEVYISDSALRQPKIVAARKCSWHVCASCHYDVSSFPTYLQSNRTPRPRVNLWVGGGCRLVLDCVENCGQA